MDKKKGESIYSTCGFFFPVSILNTGEACLITSCVGSPGLELVSCNGIGLSKYWLVCKGPHRSTIVYCDWGSLSGDR